MNQKGFHIGFCGIDGAGKTTAAARVCKKLRDRGQDVIFYDETRNFIGEIAYTLAKSKGLKSGREFLGEELYNVAMAFEIVRRHLSYIQPFVAKGINIVTPRTIFDWLAGAIARECREKEYNIFKEILLFCGLPDTIFWINTTPEIASERIKKRQTDTASLQYLKRYRDGFERVLSEFAYVELNGDLEVDDIVENAMTSLETIL